MKKLIFTFLISITLISYGQAPQEISYQGVARNASGSLLANQNIGIKLDLHQGSASGAVLFSETHSKTTNSFGLFNLGIGSVNTAAFTAINWAGGPYFMEVSMDPAGGSSYISVGTQQFMSVPYALYAKTAGNASPTPTITINAPNTVTSASGAYTINIPATISYSAGNGIDITGGVISNTAAAVTPTIVGTGATTVNGVYPNLTINTPTVAPDQTVSLTGIGNATVTGAYPNFTVNVPSGFSLPAGLNGQFLYNNGTIWDTLPRTNLFFDGTNFGVGTTSPQATFHVVGAGRFDASVSTPQIYTDNIKITGGTSGQVLTSDAIGNGTWQNLPSNSTTVTGTGIAAVTPTTGNVFNVDVPQPSLNYNNTSNVLTLTQGSAVTTASLTGTGSSTISMTGAGIANVSPTAGSAFTVTVPNPTITIASGSLSISNGNSVAIPSPSLTVNSNSLTINGPGGNTVVLPSAVSQTLSVSGNSLSISGGNTVTLPPSPITGIGTGIATATTSVNNFTVNVPTQTLTVTSNSVITSNLGGTATITPAVLSYTAGTNTLKLTDGLSVNTVTLNSSSTTSLTPGVNVTVLGTAPSYTVSAPAYSISIPGGNVVQITNGPSTSTAAINATSLTLNGTNNNILSAGGNTVALNTYTSGTGITMTGTAPNYTLSSPSQTLGITGNSLSISGANTVILPPSVITGTGTGIATVTTSVNNFTVNVPSPTFTPANGVLSFGGTNTVVVSPTLTLTGSTLTSGAPTNSVNLSSLSVWSNSVGVLYPTTLTNSVGVGTNGPLTDKMEINYASSPMNTHLHLKQMGADSSSRIKFSNSVAPSKFWINAIGSVANDMNSGYNFYYHNGTIGRSLFTVVGNGKVSVNIGSAPFPTLFEVNGGIELDSTIAVNGLNAMPPPSLLNSGKIYYDRTNQRFKVSQNGGAYVDLLGGGAPSPWLQAPGRVTLNNLTDSVGIGTAFPLSKLHVSGISDPLQITLENGGGNFKTGFHIKTALNSWFIGQESFATSGFRITDIDAAAVRLQIDQAGKVGIGTTFPSEKLDVNGNIKLDSSLMVAGLGAMPPNSNLGNGRIYFDQLSGKFKVSENNGPYVDLIAGGPPSPWIQGTGIVTQGTINDKVGIGTNIPASLLHIVSSPVAPTQLLLGNANQPNIEWEWRVDGLSNLSLINEGNGTPFTSMLVENTTGNIGIGILSPTSKFHSSNSGTITSAGKFDITNSGNTNNALIATTIGAGSAIQGLNTGTGNAGIFSVNNATSSAVGVQVTTNGAGNALNANANTGTAINASSGGAVASMLVNNSSSGDGLQVFAGSGRGINATNNSNIVAAAQFYNNGTSVSLLATKNATTTGGNVARFENNSTSNAADAVFVKSDGAGATIHAVNGPTVTGSSNAALWLENGHMKATGAAVTTGSLNVSGGFVVPSIAPVLTNCNDVKGTFSFTTSATGIVAGAFIELQIVFAKPFITIPTVIATSVSDLQGFNYMVMNTTTTSFFVRVYRTANTNITLPTAFPSGAMFKFNYMVIE